MAKCSRCNGYGFHDCFMCYGTGKVAKGTKGNTCENCHGRGTMSCHECKGSGKK